RITTRSPTTPVPNAPITDDQWLASLADTGIAGVGALAWLFVRFFRKLRRAARDGSSRAYLCAALAAAVTSYSVGMLTYDSLGFIQVTFILFIYLAVGAAVLNVPPEEWRLVGPTALNRPRPRYGGGGDMAAVSRHA